MINTVLGYSGSDLKALCTEAAFGPCREVSNIESIDKSEMRSVNLKDFVVYDLLDLFICKWVMVCCFNDGLIFYSVFICFYPNVHLLKVKKKFTWIM